MTLLATIAAVAASTAVLALLAATDPKRRRAFKLPPRPRDPWTARAMAVGALLPGILLLAADNGAAFVVWLGAVTVTGWTVAAMTPQRAAALYQGATNLARTARTKGRGRAEAEQRLAELERRIAALEAALAAAPAPKAARKPRTKRPLSRDVADTAATADV